MKEVKKKVIVLNAVHRTVKYTVQT